MENNILQKPQGMIWYVIYQIRCFVGCVFSVIALAVLILLPEPTMDLNFLQFFTGFPWYALVQLSGPILSFVMAVLILVKMSSGSPETHLYILALIILSCALPLVEFVFFYLDDEALVYILSVTPNILLNLAINIPTYFYVRKRLCPEYYPANVSRNNVSSPNVPPVTFSQSAPPQGSFSSPPHAPSQFCRFCGNPLKADSAFCDKCGKQI